MSTPLNHGLFMAPYHPVEESPTIALRRDIELIEWIEKLGFQEAWIGEHHSCGYEMIASPELMIAAAAERTHKIRLGTGVITLPYHNPLMVANRIIQLDHMTMGRAMFGFGPGLLPTDASMLDIEPSTQRERMMESLRVIIRLLDGETVTEKTDWYSLKDARAHLLPYSQPRPELAVASAVTSFGGHAAGQYGLSMLCVAATDSSGYSALDTNWKIAQDVAIEHGRVMDPASLRLVGQMHIAETREKARENVRFGLEKWFDYVSLFLPVRFPKTGDIVDRVCSTGSAVVGTPDDAIAMIERLQAKQGNFGVFLQQAHDWADWEATKKSHELYARFVMPHFSNTNRHRVETLDHAQRNKAELGAINTNAAAQSDQRLRAASGH